MSLMDYPNREALGLDPPWVEGTGGSGKPAPTPQRAAGEEPGLDEMTKAELLDHARSIGASPANNDMTKDELRESIDAKNRE